MSTDKKLPKQLNPQTVYNNLQRLPTQNKVYFFSVIEYSLQIVRTSCDTDRNTVLLTIQLPESSTNMTLQAPFHLFLLQAFTWCSGLVTFL